MTLQEFFKERDLAGMKPESIDALAKSFGQDISRKIKTNQVRNFFSSVEKLRSELKKEKQFTSEMERDLILLKPKMAYAAGRQRDVKPFYDLVEHAVNITTSSKDKNKALDNFIRLVEAIVAYHKFFGGN